MVEQLKIRQLMESDLAVLRSLVVSLSGSYLCDEQSALPDWLSQSLTEEQFRGRLRSPEHVNLVAMVSGRVAGYLCMTRSGHLYHLFVAEPFQGRGIARVLWENASAYCECTCYTVRSSLQAVPVYERFGFISIGPIDEKAGVRYQAMERSRLAR